MKQQAQKKRSAFTLIEIMVATVIMIILVGLVIQITSEVLKVWNRSSGKLAANAEARIALDLITQDLETAVFRSNGKQWLRVDAPAASGGQYGNQTVALKLFSPALDRDQSLPGDLCAIGYHLEYGPAYDGASDNVYALYRMLKSPEVTFVEYMGSKGETVQDSLTGASPGWDKADIVVESNYLAGNIIDFKVLLYVEDTATGTSRLLNANSDLELLSESFYYGGTTGAGLIDDNLLYSEVILSVISDEGLRLLQRYEDVGGPFEQYTSPDDIVRLHAESYSRRVNFVARPL